MKRLKTGRLWIYRMITGWLPESRCYDLKCCMLRWAGAKIGHKVRIYSSCRISGDGYLEIGDDVHIGAECHIAPMGKSGISIGSCVDVGPQVTILTGTHRVNSDIVRAMPSTGHMAGTGQTASVVIEDGCWLCARSTILPGVKIAFKTIVAAGSVVTKSHLNGSCLLAGIPAEVRKKY